MQFLTPLFWWGALAVSVPVLIHLVQRQSKDRIPFASLMFVPSRQITQLRRRKLEHLLLLLLRCLGLLLLIAAFARPVVNAAWFDRFNSFASRSVIILIDHSLSMARPQVWDAAVRAAEARINSLRESDEGLLIQFSDSVEVLSRWETDRQVLLHRLGEFVKPSFESTSYVEALKMAAQQFDADRYPTRDIYLITDLQRSGLGPTQGWKVPPEIRVEIEDVGQDESNLFIEDVRLERDVFKKTYPGPILVRLATDPSGAMEGDVQLFIEGVSVSRQTFRLDEAGQGQVTLDPFDLAEGVTRGKIVVGPLDGVESDNTFHFVIERKEADRVLIVADRESRSLHLNTALSTGDNLPLRSESVQTLTGIPSSVQVVVLNDVSRPPSASLLRTFVEGGGGLILVLGRNTDARTYGGDWETLLEAKLVEKTFVRSRQRSFTAITDVSWDHTIFAPFREIQRSAVSATQFFGYWKLDPSEHNRTIASFQGGDPALLDRRVGKGRVLIFSSSLDGGWSDFPVRSVYLPFWQGTVNYAADVRSASAGLRVGQAFDLEASAEEGSSGTWNVIDPTRKRVLGLDGQAPDSFRLKQPGHYEIRDNKKTDWIAVNTQPQESLLNRVRGQDFEALLVPGGSRLDAVEAEAAASVRERQQGVWWILLLSAAGIFLLEALIANRTRTAQGV